MHFGNNYDLKKSLRYPRFVHFVAPSGMHHHHHHHHVRSGLFGYMDTGGVVYTVPRTWHPHTFDGNPPKRPTSHLIVDILGLAADGLDTSEDENSSGKPDSRPESADSIDTCVTVRRRIGIQDRDPGGLSGGKAGSSSGGNRTWSGSVADQLMWTTRRGMVDVSGGSRSAEWSRSRDDQSLEGQSTQGQ